MKKSVSIIVCILSAVLLLCGCGGDSSDVKTLTNDEAVAKSEDKAEEDETEAAEVSDAEQEEAPEEEEDYWKGPEGNEYDGGEYFTSLATQFNNIFRNLTIEEAAEKYAITLVDDGKYADYEGDIGDVIPEYKDIDLDGDGKTDVIKREGTHYIIECSGAGTFETGDFSTSPNEGEIIEFEDTACRNIDEIMIAHYTFGTGGPVVWNTSIYSYQKGKWKEYPIIDSDNDIRSQDLKIYINKRTGKKYEPGLVTVSAADMTTLLLNFGYKEGPEQINDYEAMYLFRNFTPDHVDDGDDYTCYAGADFQQLLNYWPLEVSGEHVEITADTQSKLNTFMSNFSEQNYSQEGVWEVGMAHFALEWQKINKALKPVSTDKGFCYRISHSDMNNVLGRYFGTNLEEGEFYNCDIDNEFGGYIDHESEGGSYYCEPAADGEMYAHNAFTVVNDVENLAYDKPYSYMRLKFKVYRLDEDDYDQNGIGKAQYSLSADAAAQQAKMGKLYEAYEGTAIVIQTGDEFWLSQYSVTP